MDNFSLILIVAGAVVIAAALFFRHRAQRQRHDLPSSYEPAPHTVEIPDEFDPLFSTADADAGTAYHELDKLGRMLADEPETMTASAAPAGLQSDDAMAGASSRTPASRKAPTRASRPPAAVATTQPAMSAAAAAPSTPRRRPPRAMGAHDHLVTVNVMGKHGVRFNGAAVRDALLHAGLEYGHMNIFHYYPPDSPEAAPVFSVANALKPGSFDMNLIDSFATAGLSMFLVCTGDSKDLHHFDHMLGIARDLAEHLGGEVRDARRNVLSRQAITHLREEISEWCRKARVVS